MLSVVCEWYDLSLMGDGSLLRIRGMYYVPCTMYILASRSSSSSTKSSSSPKTIARWLELQT